MQSIQILCSPGADGTFDFLSNTIHLKRLKFEDIWRIQTWYNDASIFAKLNSDFHQATSDKADIVHELTHFLDATTTLWGMEYNLRKGRVARLLATDGKSDELKEAFDVFMVSSSEIDVHHALAQSPKSKIDLERCDFGHFISQHEQYGPLLFVQFAAQDASALTVPVSMLSVLEAHAYANELISRINDASAIVDTADRQRALANIERNYSALMQRTELTEYTLFLHLANRGLACVELRVRLRLVSALLRRVLDFDVFEMSTTSMAIARYIENEVDGASLVMDMNRGSSRPGLAFKLLIHFCQFLSAEQHSTTISCHLLVEKFLRSFVGTSPSPMGSFELEWMLSELVVDCGLTDHAVIPLSARLNGRRARRMSYADGFAGLSLVDPLLGDGSVLKLKRRIATAGIGDPKEVERSLRLLRQHYMQADTSKFFMRF